MNEPASKTLFLDRDGTINFDPGYIDSPERLQLLPGAAAAIRRAMDGGFRVAVISNQSGVGRGLIRGEALPEIHRRMNQLLEDEAGAHVDFFACCVHRPEEGCGCRKPLPRLVFEAQAQLGADLRRSAFIGDRVTDVRTGQNAGVRFNVLVRTGQGRGQEALIEPPLADHVAEDLSDAVDWVLARLDR